MSLTSTIEDQDAYNNIQNYRNELRDEFVKTLTHYVANRLEERISELDSLLAHAEILHPEFKENYHLMFKGNKVINPGTT